MDPAVLRQLVESDVDGLLVVSERSRVLSADERLIESFREIQAFVAREQRPPERSRTNVSESRLAMRLEAMRNDDAQREVLLAYDEFRLLEEQEPPASIEDALANDSTGLLEDDSLGLLAGPYAKAQTMPERIARRVPCQNFEDYRELFASCQRELRAGARKLLPFRNPREIEAGRFFVQSGVLLLVAEVGERTADAIGKANARTRCVFENGTESDLLLQSLASNLYKNGRRVTEPMSESLQRMEVQAGTPMASVYVLRSRSEDPQLATFTDLHKIGSTRQGVASRVKAASSSTTFLGADVDTVAAYEVPTGTEKRLEAMLHTLFASVRLDAWFQDGDAAVDVREWFAVPLSAIDEAIHLIENGTAANFRFDRDKEQFVLTDE